MDLTGPRPSASKPQILLALFLHLFNALKRNRKHPTLSPFAPGQYHAPVQLPSRTDAVGLSTFARQLIHIAPHQGRSSEDYFNYIVQLFQISLQSRAQSTQLLSIFFCLHLFTINCIQIYKSQEKKIDTSKKMFQLCQGNSMLAGVQTTPSAVSESQLENWVSLLARYLAIVGRGTFTSLPRVAFCNN